MKNTQFIKMLIALAFLGTMGASAFKAHALPNIPDSVYLFSYNSGKNQGKNGLHHAWSADRKTWKGIGPEHAFIKSDFGTWGAEKRMYNPYLLPFADGIWRIVFQLNDQTNQFAVAQSKDLIVWEPQDYPQIKGVTACIQPVLTYDSVNKEYKVWFKDLDGKHYLTVSKDFYHFPLTQTVMESAYKSATEAIKIEGVVLQGQVHKIPYSLVANMIQAQENAFFRAQRHGELAKDNPSRFSGIASLEAKITINAGEKKKISNKLIGIFFEDINYAADGGLYAELIQNRDFEYNPSDTRGHNKNWNAGYAWTLKGEGGKLSFAQKDPIHPNNPNYAVVNTEHASDVSLQNTGFDGIVVRKGEKYKISLFSRQLQGKAGKLTVKLIQDGCVLAQTVLPASGKEWKKYQAVLKASSDADRAVLAIEPSGLGTVAFDMISLFPENTYKGRENGLRNDLAQVLADMKPRFIRFPGGCAAHGDGLHNIYNWKETIGPLESRKPQRNIWGYHQTKGLGYFEYFRFCEDIGCEPLPVLAAGVCCQNSNDGGHGQQGGIPMERMPQYIQDILDLIEWANGDAKKTYWGRQRALQGHPQSFNLKYIGIGNEDLISKTFEDRYLMIIKAIKQKYPEIIVCGTVGPFCEGSDYERGWEIAKEHQIDMVDEHYYQTPGWFIYNQDYYDQYDRSASKVYLGEYAAHVPGRHNNIETALCEALYLCGVERNGDVVAMTSYAPLLAKEGYTQWNPDLIYFNNKEVKPTVGYYVQKMFGNSSGDSYLDCNLLINEQRAGIRERLALSAVQDSSTGKVYLKLVNVLNHPVKAKINLQGFEDRLKEKQIILAKAQVLSGDPGDRGVRPQEKTVQVSSTFVYEMPPYSFTLIEL